MYKHGFTLIELLIVMTIMGIIVMAGYPSYQSYLREVRRQDAIQDMLEIQITIENYIVKYNTLPPLEDIPSRDSKNGLYSITYTMDGIHSSSYYITATAKEGTTQVDDTAGATSCATLLLQNVVDSVWPYECK